MKYKKDRQYLKNDKFPNFSTPAETEVESIQNLFQQVISEFKNVDIDKNLFQLNIFLETIYKAIYENNGEITPFLPVSMEYNIYYIIKSFQSTLHELKELKLLILSYLFKIINFLTNDDKICQRFITIEFHTLLIEEILFKNRFTQLQSKDLAFSICHLIDFHLSQNKDADFINNFFEGYPIASFLNPRIDIIDQINFLVIFSKYCLAPELAYEITSQILKIILLEEMAPQLAWIMVYIMQNNIDNMLFLFSHPQIQENESKNLFYKVSAFLESDIVDESFYIPYLKFCIRALRQLEVIDANYQIIVHYQIHSKILNTFDLHKASCKFLELFIRFLNIIFKYDEGFFSEDLILVIIDLGVNSEFYVVNQIMIFLTKVIPISSIEFVATIFRSEFFLDCLDSITSGIDIVILSKIIFLIYEKIEAFPDLFDEYITINSDHETVEAFNIAVKDISIKNMHSLDILFDYWGKMQNAISLLDSDESPVNSTFV